MIGWRLAPGTGYCEIGSELVFLDLSRDKYLALRGGDRAAFLRLRAGEPNDSDAMGRLVATGFLARAGRETELAPASIDIPGRDISTLREERFSAAMALSTARALRTARRGMRPDQIATTIERRRQRKKKVGVPGANKDATRVAASYAASRWINPEPPRCLIDALALDHILLSRGLAAAMVFGVRLEPFAAHCWLQTPETVLTGTAAEARNFTPILVVG
ncbi:hypothetical protein ATE67_02660 [Sphingopyxis sp. H050]|jgi:hypothetical protein|uniref:lasso peptide biosynthesis B2 protein n=1 Tax=Sphingopyxis sp. H050 TaxID=1759072 RepID=UPI0007364189|nr:lasso peptide biosynthesis B2 protein [Sphingopyxis sp. H050]KTE22836.1 hypothetical protein ATE67_02660 [Sphingopyxis sp. H050]